MAAFFAEEVSWFEHQDERVLGAVLCDRTDRDFTGMIMARDRRGRFRAVGFATSEETRRRAEVTLRREMEHLAMAPDEEVNITTTTNPNVVSHVDVSYDDYSDDGIHVINGPRALPIAQPAALNRAASLILEAETC
jgi:hypothetical protein